MWKCESFEIKPCIKMIRPKLELTNQDSAASRREKLDYPDVSDRQCQLTGKGMKPGNFSLEMALNIQEKRMYNSKNHIWL